MGSSAETCVDKAIAAAIANFFIRFSIENGVKVSSDPAVAYIERAKIEAGIPSDRATIPSEITLASKMSLFRVLSKLFNDFS